MEAWVDAFGSWRDELERKLAAGQEDLASELAEGAGILEEVATAGLRGADRRTALAAAEALRADGAGPERAAAGLAPEVAVALERATSRPERLRTPLLEVDVDRERARFGAWYELFPRSFGGLRGRRGRSCRRLAELGFDVVYLPPIHPIGVTNRKGRNNAARRRRRATPAARGRSARAEGGHDAVHPELGTLADFERLVAAARDARHRDRARLRDPVLARPPVADRAPGVVPPPPGRHAEVRREPAQALPGHLQRQLRQRRLAGAVGRRCATSSLFWVERGRADLPGRQPAHQADRRSGSG